MYHKLYGITQDPKTKNYMVVLDEKCQKCNYICNTIHFQKNFENWTSGNNDIDKFIQDVQLSAHSVLDAIEWIPYDRFHNIKYISKKKFYANWLDGYINYWHNENQNWKRKDQNMLVILNSLNDSKDIKSELSKV